MLWLIDYTHYQKEISPDLKALRRDYFRIKGFVKRQRTGECEPPRQAVYSVGLLRIATILQYNKIPVRYLHYDQLEEILNTGAQELPEEIAFSAVCPSVPLCAGLCERIKARSPRTRVSIGGSQVNAAPKLTKAKYGCFDRYLTGYELEAAERIAEKPLVLPDGPYVDFGLLPFPLEHYAVNTFSTLGCPFHCSYCQDGRMPYLEAGLDGQLGEMRRLLPARTQIHFFDSVLGYSPERMKEVCRAIQGSGHSFVLSCDLRAEYITRESLALLEEAGFAEIRLGLESASEELLRYNNRSLTPRLLDEKLALARRYSKLYLTLYSATALPGTTWKTFEETRQLFSSLLESGAVDEIKNCLYVPYPRDDCDYGETGVRILDERWENYDRQSRPVFEYDGLSADEIWEQYMKISETINESWLKQNGFHSVSEIPETGYAEYLKDSYRL